MHLEKHTKHLATSVIAIGTVFTDEVLHPQERIERTLVFSVPSEKYTQIEVRVFLPTMQQEQGIDLELVWLMARPQEYRSNINSKFALPSRVRRCRRRLRQTRNASLVDSSHV